MNCIWKVWKNHSHSTLEPPAIQDNALNLNWDVSYDFDAEDITYTVELATDYQFQNVIFRQEGVAVPEVQTSVPASRPVLCTGTCN